MQQVKLFKTVESEISALEADINRWIRDSGARILNITANIAPQTAGSAHIAIQNGYAASDILVVALYDDGKSPAAR